MANLTQTNPYANNITAFPEDIVRVDVTDRVKGHDPAVPGVIGKANEQALQLMYRTVALLARIVGIETTLGTFSSANLAQLDLLTLKYENTRQAVTVAAGDTTKAINLASGAIVSLTLSNTNPCTFSFTNNRASLSGVLILTANGGDRTFILPSTWQPQDVSRTLVVRSGQKRMLAFETETLSPDVIVCSGLSEPLYTV